MGQNLQFLTLQPKYKCSKDPKDFSKAEPCLPLVHDRPDAFCDKQNGLYPKVNYTDDTSLDNWFEDMNL